MAVPRPLLLALLGVLLLVATFSATRVSREDSVSKSTAQTQPAKPKTQAASQSAAKRHKAAAAPSRHATAAKEHAARSARRQRAASPSKPAAVARAVSRGKVVVLAFFQPGADDRASAAAVATLRGRHMAVVVTDRIGNVARYGPMVQGIGIDQAPAIVIVDRQRRARVIEGYVDPETLAQEVNDVRG
jgi:hypothetical protein